MLADILDVAPGVLFKRAAASQAGVIAGLNPIAFDTNDPFRLWVIQVAIIILMTQLLSIVLTSRYVRQPRVIAEVIGGVLLGPTVMGRIPGFTNSIFPIASLPYLNLTATIGIVLYLFLTALEVDISIVNRNARSSTAISVAGIALPFGIGAAVAVPLYNNFVNKELISFAHFILFSGVAISITAFPVLCRILTELKLLDTNVGIIVLSAGVGNDVVGWILLALTVALVNAAGGLTALYVFLAAAGWTLFMIFPVKWALRWLLRKTGSLENGTPTPLAMVAILMIVFFSAFMTDVLGVHAIFGGFIAGLIIPHKNGFAISLTEKLEDFVILLLIPIYFALSGLKTNLSLLDNGTTWGYVVLLCVVAFVGKFFGCALAARACGFSIRESGAIGTLMSCKGLVELIVLNVGLQAGILDTRLFSMFVVMAIVLTFITTPLCLAIYPEQYQVHYGSFYIGGKDVESKKPKPKTAPTAEHDFKTRFSVVLNKIENLPAVMTLTQLLQPGLPSLAAVASATSKVAKSEITDDGEPLVQELLKTPDMQLRALSVDALRLIELTDRTSAVMQSAEADELIHHDPVLSIFRTFGHINRVPISASLAVVNQESFSSRVAEHAREKDTEMVILPWHSGAHSLDDQAPEGQTIYNPFNGIFGYGRSDNASSVIYSHFIRRVFATSPTDVALFVDRGTSHSGSLSGAYGQHILFPFSGGPDDRLALDFVVQLCANPTITATVIRINKLEDDAALSPVDTDATDVKPAPHATVHSMAGFPDTVYGPASTQHRLESEGADNLLWARYAKRDEHSNPVPLPHAAQSALTRITFEEVATPRPLHALVERAVVELKACEQGWKSLFIVAGRGRRLAESHHNELRALVEESGKGYGAGFGAETSRTVGDVAAAFVASGTNASLLVLQAADAASLNA